MKNQETKASLELKRGRLAIALTVALAAYGTTVSAQTPGTEQGSWVQTRNHVHADIAGARFVSNANDTEPLTIAVTMKLRNEGELDQLIKETHRPGSASYHAFLSAAQSTATYAPTEQQAQAVANHLTQAGFTNVQIAPNRMIVTAQGTVATARAAFHTTIGHFSLHGRDAIANTADVQVPAALGNTVDRVLGLQTVNRPRVYSLPVQKLKPAYSVITSVDGNPNAHGYKPQEFATVYDAGSLAPATSTAVAIVGWGSMTTSAADLVRMEKDQGIPQTPTTIKGYGGSKGATGNDDTGQGEWAMDAQAIAGTSGGVKSLTFYTAYSNAVRTSNGLESTVTTAGLVAAINGAVSDNTAKVINLSWGDGGEVCTLNGSANTDSAWADSYFKLGVAQGQTFSVSSGDNGAYPCPTAAQANTNFNGEYGDKTQPAVSYPASSPYVVAVGGTTLNTTVTDSYISEKVWPYSGGGVSQIETKPTWQSNVSGNYRAIPDVAFDGDWTNSPIIYYLTSNSQNPLPSGSGYYSNGGTSLASPLFVGSWARLESAHTNSIGFAAPALYAYGKTLPVHDVTSGSNGAYSAAAGWDYASGWGSFDISAINSFINSTPGFISTSNQH
ncbi:S53 family peptidase [Burkholderia alba]|uniref:S53 family peptidase n=1 Tax=Burkholderia alba TaxID=2683677 RepID=UPI002B05C26B|nr:S53 family peptidase [Burkholderia alba]